MPPKKIHLVRHAQGEHNVAHNYTIPDPLLTHTTGKSQCVQLASTFPHHSSISTIFCSPLRRTIQTACLSFGPALARPDVQFVLLPLLQEITDFKSDTGSADTADEMKTVLEGLFKGEEVGFDVRRVDVSAVREGWNAKESGYWGYERSKIERRAGDLRGWLFELGEDEEIVLVTHGAIAHFITEDYSDVEDPMMGTAYRNCEHREFVFTAESTATDAHMIETQASKARREKKQKEKERAGPEDTSTPAAAAGKDTVVVVDPVVSYYCKGGSEWS